MSEVMKKVEWKKRELSCEVVKGRGKWICMKVVGKEGKEKKYVMREVEKFYWEGEEEEGFV